MDEILKSALDNIPSLKKPQKTFVMMLLSAFMTFAGKATFRNLSRYSGLHEKRISRWFLRTFDFLTLNCQLLSAILSKNSEIIAAMDASFLPKSGKHTEGLAKFWDSKSSKAQKGLEVSLISVVDIKANTAYALDARQTVDIEGKTRTDLYAEHLVSTAEDLKRQGVTHVAVDAFYAKVGYVDPVCATGLHPIGKLRHDAKMRWLFQGEYSGRGCPRKFDGKIKIDRDLERFSHVKQIEKGKDIYSAVVNYPCFKRSILVVLIRDTSNPKKVGHALLYTTDLDLDPLKLYSYYQARYQIEFVFRDAKQHTGLMDCQARNSKSINNHLNTSFCALNLMKLEDRLKKKTDDKTVISIASWKRRKFNQQYMKTLFSCLGLDLSSKKVFQAFSQFSAYGEIAA